MACSKWLKEMALYSSTALSVLALGAVPSMQPAAYAQATSNTLTVQGQQQSTYARLVFDIPAGTNYSVTSQDEQIRVTIDGVYAANFDSVQSASLRRVGNGRQTVQSGQTVLIFDTLPGVSPRDFRTGGYVVVDVYGGDLSASLPDSSNASMTLPNDDGSATDNSGTAAPDETGSSPNSTNSTDDPEPIQELPANSSAAETEPDDNNTVVLDEGDAARIGELRPRSESTLILSGISDADKDPETLVTTEVAEADAGILMRFTLPSEAAVAAFLRGNNLWLIFDQPLSIDPTGLVNGGKKLTDRVTRLAQRPHLDALILRLTLADRQNPVVERDGQQWLLYLKDTPAKPRFPLEPTTSQSGQGQQIFVAATEIGRKIEFEDPVVGDLLTVLPLLREGNGLAQDYSYAAAELLESAQGVVVVPQTDFVDVERFPDGIAIRTTGNDALSASQLPNEVAGGASQAGFARLIDFKTWRYGNEWEYRKNKARLFLELSHSNDVTRNDVRWKLAKFFIAHGRASESLGMLQMMLNDDPLFERNTAFLAVRGVANYKLGRLEAAQVDLSSRELEAEQDAELWNVLVSEALGDYKEALEYYRRGRDVMGTYDVDDRAEIVLAVIRAAIETGDIELAQRELDLINGLDLDEDQVAEQLLQQARIAEMQGQYDIAFEQYDALATAPQHWVSARARYARTKFGVQNGDITPEEAIDELERLRYSWRGERFEAQLLDDLAGYYFETKQYEAGLEALQLAVSNYPDIATEKRMLLRQQYVFKQLFLEGRADDMSPISAISLFRKFSYLTPLGAEGDLLIRKLSQRMVSVDLLGRAAEVLDYQIRGRLEGVARANVAADLAKIYIMDQKPDLALEILRATREPRLPDDVAAARRHVETRALIEQKRYEEAEVMLEGDRSRTADELRADIYWGAQDWPRVTSTIRRLLGDGWRRNQPLTALQRMNLVRLAIAMTFAEDRAGLIEMRRRYATQMRGGDFANAFDLLTSDQELTGRELNSIASQIASVEKLQSFMQSYRNDFSGR